MTSTEGELFNPVIAGNRNRNSASNIKGLPWCPHGTNVKRLDGQAPFLQREIPQLCPHLGAVVTQPCQHRDARLHLLLGGVQGSQFSLNLLLSRFQVSGARLERLDRDRVIGKRLPSLRSSRSIRPSCRW